MRFNQLTATNEDLGQETPEEVSMVETQQANQEVVDGEAELDTLTNTADSIDQGMDTIESGVDEIEEAQTALGGDDASGVASPIEEITVESLLNSIHRDLGTTRLQVGTSESRGHTSRATIVATLEAEKEGLMSRMITGIKAALSTVVSFFRNLFQSKKGLEKYIDGLITQAKSNSGGASGTVAAKFQNYNQAIQALKGIDRLIYNANTAADEYNAIRGKEMKHVNQAEVDEDVDVEGETMEELMNRMLSETKSSETVFAGGQMVDYTKKGMTFTKAQGGGDYTKGEALNQSQCLSLLQAAKSSVGRLQSMAKVENALTVAGKNLIDVMTVSFRAHTNRFRSEEGKTKNMAKGALSAMTVVYRTMAFNAGTKVPSFAFKNIKAAADYAKASMGGAAAPAEQA